MAPRIESPHVDCSVLGLPAIVLHGGAGTFSLLSDDGDDELLVSTLRQATDAGWEVLAAGGAAFDAVVEAVACLEDSGVFNAGRGAVPTTEGRAELDAGVMDGRSGAVGSLCAVTYPANPVRAARALADFGQLPGGPVLLAGPGGDQFCREQGLVEMRDEWLTRAGPAAGRPDKSGPDKSGPDKSGPDKSGSGKGTVGAVAADAAGALAAATSTGGREGQLPGRVGDSPIPGAGVLAGKSVAVSATGEGEAFMVAGFSHEVAWSIGRGARLEEAMIEALGTVAALSATGGAIALTAEGEMTTAFTTRAMARSWRGPHRSKVHIFPS